MNAIIRGDECQGPHQVGAKGWSLACAQRAGLCVPAWFAVAPAALRSIDGAPSDALRAELATAVSELCPDTRLVAVRSSALDEDGARLSFAGQLESFLFVPAKEVADRVSRVWRSASSLRLAAYRERLAGAAGQGATAVLVQRMVRAHTAGVAFSADPVSGRRAVAVVAAGSGVATGIVSGERDADTWHIGRCGRIESRSIAGTQPCITDDQAHEVAALARLCERCFGVPQDIEWAYEEGRLWLLQSRPITSIAALPDPDGEIALWDSSNIAESYGGVVTALTFSYIRRNYEHVYRELCRLAGVGSEALAGSDDALRRMLGLVRGRVYYNLLSWYRLLALVPGFAHNRRFLDQMLGVREGATRAVLEEVVAAARRVTPRPALAFATQAARMAALLATVERRNRRFRQRLDDALEAPEVLLEDMRTDELVAHFRALDRRLLDRWDAPLVNDFFAMVYHGLLRRLAERWCATRAHGLANDLLAGQTDIVSLEPVRRIREMALVAAAHPDLARELREGERESILARLRQVPELSALYEDYLRLFGDRCFEELKLESATLETDPLPLLRAVGHLAANPVRENATACAAQVRGAAEGRVRAALRSHPLRRIAFGWVLRNARARVGDRENLRFDRTRIFGRVRRIFVEIGRRFHALGLLESPHDIFHLELDEIVRFVEGGATCTDLKALAAVRKAQFTRHQRYEPPPDRFETRGVASHGDHGVRPHRAPGGAQGGEERQATGCCPGVVRGRARIVNAPEAALLKSGEILVAERTDPGWVMLFAAASGLVVERGSLLSHAAIVARELGIPAVIGLRDACRWLADGDLIEVDGESGVVRRLERSGAGSAA